MKVEQLTAWIEGTWWPFVQSATVASLAVLLVVSLAWLAWRRRGSAHLGYALFLLPLVPFVIPLRGMAPLVLPIEGAAPSWMTSEASTEVFEWHEDSRGPLDSSVGRLEVGRTATTETAPVAPQPARGAARSRAVTEAGPGNPSLSWPLIAFGVWASVSLLLAIRWMRQRYRTTRLARGASAIRDSRTRLLVRRTAKDAGLHGVPRLVESQALHSPAVCGFWRPTLLLPAGLDRRLDDQTLAWSLHHEFAHLRRNDLWVASLQRALQILWWFHPLVWVLNHVVAELRECACDEAALARMPELSRRRAASALIDIVASSRRQRAAGLALESLYTQKQSLEKRIMRLIDSRHVCRPGLTPAALLLLSLTAGVGFASTQLEVGDREPRPPEPPIEIVAGPRKPADEPIEVPREQPAVQEPVEEIEEEVVGRFTLKGSSADDVDGQDAARAAKLVEGAKVAVARSLDWLLLYQKEDGHWETGHPRTGMAGEFNDVGVTALAVECLLASAKSEHQDAARRGLRWIASVQDEELGLFGTREGFGFNASHAQATRLLLRVQGPDLSEQARARLQKAVEYIQRARNPYGAWRFAYPPVGDNDVFVTSLMLRALAEARRAGLEVDPRAIHDGQLFLDEVTDPSSGRTGYDSLGGAPARLAGKSEDFPPEYSEYPTAMAILARIDLGVDPVDSQAIIAGGGLIARLSPTWDPVKGKNDAYHWLYGTEALRQLGGVGWKRWRRELFEALPPNQRSEGTWPLMDAWSGSGDRAHITSVYTLALQEALRGE